MSTELQGLPLLKDQVAIVTGSAQGIGEGIARSLGRFGAQVVIADIDKAKAQETAARLVAGGIRAIGVASSKRSPALPDAPAINESLKGFESDNWFGLMMPAGTPRDVVTKLNAQVVKILGTQDVKDRLLAQGGVATAGTPEQLAEQIKADIAKWGKVARTAGVRIE